jgi:SAM-dependent methyltransferase
MSCVGLDPHVGISAPSEWVVRFAPFIPAAGRVLDLACGQGRHARFLAQLGYRVSAADRDERAVASLAGVPGIEAKAVDLERGPWPYPGERFAGIVVVNYLYRPLFPLLLESLETGGVLVYETFAHGNERYGRPSNPQFLLQPGELLGVVSGRLRVIAYEDLFVMQPKPALVQRICAVNADEVPTSQHAAPAEGLG